MVKQFILQDKYKEIKEKTAKISSNLLENALQSHIDYIYDYLLPERIKSVDVLMQNLETLAKSENYEKTNENLNKYFTNYFTAKYANPEFSAINGVAPLNNNNQVFSIIRDYIFNIGYYADNWLHLKKSTELIAETYPEHYLSLLLNAYAELVSGTENAQVIEQALDQISRGFIRMRQKENFDYEWYLNEIKSFLDYLYENRSDLRKHYEPIMWLRIHSVWLKDFNNKFLKKAII